MQVRERRAVAELARYIPDSPPSTISCWPVM
jgi:hypothetical protein